MRGTSIILSGFLLALACGAATQPIVADIVPEQRYVDPEEVFPVPIGTACDIWGGWSEDPDPAGLNVRAGPSPTAAILGQLPRSKYIQDEDWGDRVVPTTFDIVEVRDGWVRITNVVAPEDYFAPGPLKYTLPSGWISGRYVGFELQGEKAFAEPDPGSPVVASSWETSEGFDHPLTYRNLLDCRGAWVKMIFKDHRSREHEGWARGVCSNVETSCDGTSGDYFESGEKKPFGPDYKSAPSIWDKPSPP